MSSAGQPSLGAPQFTSLAQFPLITRFSIRRALLVTAGVAVVAGIVSWGWRFDRPIATFSVSNDPTTVFTADEVLSLSKSALERLNFEPIEPVPYRVNVKSLERYLGRYSIRPADEVLVIWRVRNGSYPTYTVELRREPAQITASVIENWL